MGQSPSQPLGRGNSRRRSLRSPFPRRHKHRQSLSATFALPDNGKNIEALNVNVATAEQLMTLPGISRQLAQSIVDYRNAIGRFQKVEDLALVSGIGAEKLDKIRPEICVKRRTNSVNSSRAPSLDSILSVDSAKPSPKPINVNTASVFELQCVNGLNQEIAANVVDHRIKKGPFKSIEDLVKVKGINYMRLGAVRSQLSIDSCDDLSRINGIKVDSNNKVDTPIKNGIVLTSTPNGIRTPGHRKTMSAPIKMNLGLSNGFSMAPVNDIYDLLSAYSHRPIVEEEFRYEREGRCALRLATWNLQDLCTDKADNPGVKEIICRTILENRFSIIALQEIVDVSALRFICDELNRPTLRRVAEWKENSRDWQYCTSRPSSRTHSGLGFLYDKSGSGFEITLTGLAEMPIVEKLEHNSCEEGTPNSLLAGFKFGEWTCWLLNVWLRNADKYSSEELVERLTTELEKTDVNGELIKFINVFAVMGDFSGVTSNTENGNSNLPGFTSVLNIGSSTAFSSPQSIINGKVIKSTCNVLIHSDLEFKNEVLNHVNQTNHILTNGYAHLNATKRNKLKLDRHYSARSFDIADKISSQNTDETSLKLNTSNSMLTGHYGVVRQGLCHMAIPRGWNWGGPASNHYPIWFEVFQNKSPEMNGVNDILISTNNCDVNKIQTNVASELL